MITLLSNLPIIMVGAFIIFAGVLLHYHEKQADKKTPTTKTKK